ncbi:MAG: protein-methionine-sulfoxide reductase catalytic subunit MsrP [Calditrichaeota bacterium]|nr:MAG: protein-methionine-sulfoxide reductase catalytic subunit MsrP [Calditrichota bacterium]
MLIKNKERYTGREITSEKDYMRRRDFLKLSAWTLTAPALAPVRLFASDEDKNKYTALNAVRNKAMSIGEKPNSWTEITTYNNFYEFGTDKSAPSRNSRAFKPRPWSVAIDGLCDKPGHYQLEDLIPAKKLEERVYSLRCVEAWSMVIPWIGVPLKNILLKAQPRSTARFVEFTSVYRPSEMPGQRAHILDWPYMEGLRLDEALHPLTFLAVGVYGRVLPNQNGAPLRLVVPWKYGFKSIKSIVRIRFTDTMPVSTWQRLAPGEYGFYANVNPEVDHPRWSQRRERRIGTFFKRETQLFNGYADEVGALYKNLDLEKWY